MIFLLVTSLLVGACSPDARDRTARRRERDPRVERKDDGGSETKRKRRPRPQPSLGDTPPQAGDAWWVEKIDKLLAGKPFSLEVRLAGETLYSRRAENDRIPASVQKLMLSMALFETFGANKRFATRLAARERNKEVIAGDLWVVGSGDPTVAGNPHYLTAMPRGATDIQKLVIALRREGVRVIEGNVMAATGPFERDWYAPGWKPYFPTSEVGLPSALAFNGNVNKGQYTKNPERLLAESLHKRLRRSGISIAGGAGSGPAPNGLRTIAEVQSPKLASLARFMNRKSSNFFAEILGKRLGARRFGPPGTIAKGARAIASFARDGGVRIDSFDSSGLSYENRVSASELASLLEQVENEPWAGVLRRGLAGGGEGTLEDRLHDVLIRAKTGTLVDISALAGWVWLNKQKAWAEFAILSRGIDKSRAIQIEDKVVRILHIFAR